MVVGEASVSAMTYFVPIFAFFLVFIVVYALLKKTGALGDGEPAMLFVSFILASFFIVEASLVEVVRVSSSWFAVLVILVFFIVALVSFTPGEPLNIFKSNWFAWVILGVIVAAFIISSAYVFNWALNWDVFQNWFGSDWFGMILLIGLAAIVSWKIKG